MLTTSVSTGLYPTLDLWNANKFNYITLPILREIVRTRQAVPPEGHAVIVCLMNMDYILECNCCRGIPL